MIGLGLPTTDEIDLRLPQAVEHELLAILDEENVRYGRIIEFSVGAGDWAIYSVAVGTTSLAIGRLSRALATFLERHKGKSVKVNLRRETFETKGYSVAEVEKLLEAVSKAKQADLEQWKRSTQRGEPPEAHRDK
jgi:hypothetical protein